MGSAILVQVVLGGLRKQAEQVIESTLVGSAPVWFCFNLCLQVHALSSCSDLPLCRTINCKLKETLYSPKILLVMVFIIATGNKL